MSSTPSIPDAVLGVNEPIVTPEPMSMLAVLRVPVMRCLWTAQLVSTFGDFLALFAVINFLTFHLHATPEQVTNLQIAYLLPIAILGVIAGVFVDRGPLKATMVTSDLVRAGLCLLLLLASSTFHFYLVLAAISVLCSFFSPAQGITIRSTVPRHGLRSANELMQQVLFGMRIVGPPLAGVLYKLLGARSCYVADAASFVCSGLLIASLSLRSTTNDVAGDISPALQASRPRQGLSTILPDIRQGISFILHYAGLLFVILALAAGMFVLGCFGPLIAVYTRDTLHASTKLYSVISAMIGLGMFLGINVLNTAGKKVPNTGSGLRWAWRDRSWSVWSGGRTAYLGGSPGESVDCIAVSGIVVPSNTMIQQETPQELMGRVRSTVVSLVFSAQIAGLILSGLLANRMGGVERLCGMRRFARSSDHCWKAVHGA